MEVESCRGGQDDPVIAARLTAAFGGLQQLRRSWVAAAAPHPARNTQLPNLNLDKTSVTQDTRPKLPLYLVPR